MSKPMLPADVYDTESGTLYGSRCATCGTTHFPPKGGCPDCFGESVERVALSQRGRVHACTVVHSALPGFSAPYALAQVDFPEGVRVVGQLAGVEDPSAVAAGSQVVLETGAVRVDPSGEEVIGYRFVPA
ncbi:Zn-ribbon domain-containing OB-fold protein [Pseudonocardia nigra]|uniref:Zn-ribbon domain-containing OB-fold protein n=1 Tax=Pseudonocardia nigra TaxID=1921578 RepID=UPI001C5F70B1|nr:Zn-ribbon domain-containing OB-fold protein [Pseudonocardia nigra]